MSQYPSAVYQPRIKLNKEGVEYDPDLPRVGFAEDITKLDDEVVAMQNEIGLNPKGEYTSLVDRILNDPLLKGPQGDQGSQGPQGDEGPIGPQGITTRVIEMQITDFDTAITTGTYKYAIIVPEELHGMLLTKFHARLKTASTSGTVTLRLNDEEGEGTGICSYATIAANQYSTFAQNTEGVGVPAYNIMNKGNIIYIDIIGAGTGAKGLYVMLSFEPA